MFWEIQTTKIFGKCPPPFLKCRVQTETGERPDPVCVNLCMQYYHIPPNLTFPNLVPCVHDIAAAETGKRVSSWAKPAILLHRVDFPVPVFPITNILRRMLFLTSRVCSAMTATSEKFKIPDLCALSFFSRHVTSKLYKVEKGKIPNHP